MSILLYAVYTECNCGCLTGWNPNAFTDLVTHIHTYNHIVYHAYNQKVTKIAKVVQDDQLDQVD